MEHFIRLAFRCPESGKGYAYKGNAERIFSVWRATSWSKSIERGDKRERRWSQRLHVGNVILCDCHMALPNRLQNGSEEGDKVASRINALSVHTSRISVTVDLSSGNPIYEPIALYFAYILYLQKCKAEDYEQNSSLNYNGMTLFEII